MARDVCSDCERHFPDGEGLQNGLCSTCREARRAMKEHAGETPPPEDEAGEEE